MVDRHNAGRMHPVGAIPARRSDKRMSAAIPLQAAGRARPRERRVCYRILPRLAALSLWKT
ncbi:hypothetical protein WT64_22750 [Burkholderia stagnalis]|nr:hypothetical protein WT20_07320 [Burkholderia stagnalis]KWH67337.1 hypothetical protein WT64_22750 [Burkholderia stagnalis]